MPGQFRRSELVSLNVEDLDFQKEGLIITLRRSKTGQTGQGRKTSVKLNFYYEKKLMGLLNSKITTLRFWSAPMIG